MILKVQYFLRVQFSLYVYFKSSTPVCFTLQMNISADGNAWACLGVSEDGLRSSLTILQLHTGFLFLQPHQIITKY